MSHVLELSGTVEDVFGHRFTLAAEGGKRLVDIGPDEKARPTAGQQVSVKGKERHGEVKAAAIRLAGGEWTPVEKGGERSTHKAGEDHPVSDADVDRALAKGGYTAGGERKRKPKHVEVSAEKDGAAYTVHVHKGGEIKKAEPIG